MPSKVPCSADKAVIFSQPGVAEKEFLEDAAQFLREIQENSGVSFADSKRPEIVQSEKDIPAGKYVWNFGKGDVERLQRWDVKPK